MITYRRGACNIFFRVTQMKGSVFPLAAAVALPGAIASFVLKWSMEEGMLPALTKFEEKSVLKATAVWSSFMFLVGFLIVFRTSQAYARFWDGCTCTHQMRAEWFDACSSLIAFCKHTRSPPETVQRFEHILIRLFSLLHAVALAEIEDSSSDDVQHIAAFKYELVDVASVDRESLQEIKDSDARVELVFQWIQQLVVENIVMGVVSIPPPLLSRTFQELANGMCQFHEAIKISTVPFPFPYAQTCDCLLLMQYIMTPIVITQLVTDYSWAAFFAFIQIFVLWTLNLTAVEIENPFGFDPNDIDAEAMQLELNRHLLLLLTPVAKRVPYLDDSWSPNKLKQPEHMDVISRKVSLSQVWTSMSTEERAKAARTMRSNRFGGSRSHHALREDASPLNDESGLTFSNMQSEVSGDSRRGSFDSERQQEPPRGQQGKKDADGTSVGRNGASMAAVSAVAAQIQATRKQSPAGGLSDQAYIHHLYSNASDEWNLPDYHDMEGIRHGDTITALEEAEPRKQHLDGDSAGSRSQWRLPLQPRLGVGTKKTNGSGNSKVVDEATRPPSPGGFPSGDDDLSLEGRRPSPESKQRRAPQPGTGLPPTNGQALPVTNL